MPVKRDINHLAIRLSKAEMLKQGMNPAAKRKAQPAAPSQPEVPVPKTGDLVRGKRTGWNSELSPADAEERYSYPNDDVQGILFVNPVAKTPLIEAYTQFLVSKVGVDPATLQIITSAEELQSMKVRSGGQ